ncbi:hypothetical protein A4H02_05255 [Fervidobacterium thailandense]|uniref:Uncharacterized protein n=1 Tax=Fervidobacterium thailandense TaxID=1008305 RepID=A0A1E3G2P6_9BACT|nr:hypothetical protein A4H02_05255 [Fervidobacterium thailandense]
MDKFDALLSLSISQTIPLNLSQIAFVNLSLQSNTIRELFGKIKANQITLDDKLASIQTISYKLPNEEDRQRKSIRTNQKTYLEYRGYI